MKNHISKYKEGDKVDVDFGTAGKLKDLFVVSIRFTEKNVYYNLLIQLDNGYTSIEDVDATFVARAKSLVEQVI